MKKRIFLIFLLLLTLPLFADTTPPFGKWAFIFYSNAPSVKGTMPPPPLFDSLELLPDGSAVLGFTARKTTARTQYTCKDNSIHFEIPGTSGTAIPFTAQFTLQPEDGTLSLKGTDSTAVFLTSEAFVPIETITGIWQFEAGPTQLDETMQINLDAYFLLRRSKLAGFCRLWKNQDQNLTLTLLAAKQGKLTNTFLWQVKINRNQLVFTPIGTKGTIHKASTFWKRK